MAGLGVAAGEARRPSLGEQVVGLVGEERPDRPVYMAGDPRTPFTPPSRGRQVSVGPERHDHTDASVCRCSLARTEDRGSKG